MAGKKYELHIWFNEWFPSGGCGQGSPGQWMWNKVVLRYENDRQRDNQVDCILMDEWWHKDRLIPFRDVLRMERREASDGTTS